MAPGTTIGEGDQLPRTLGPMEALCAVVGSVIGSGIFIVPAIGGAGDRIDRRDRRWPGSWAGCSAWPGR